ncbi:hypothetical protein AGDE_16158 [Angomonas deanei]|uniref:Uncharacterized protein n=1 Tax=Angomonas deanei TaxID=59799 RepID=A0A7G2CPN9_9TRYP|nr:hypothetical protein AGDE_16158 [Angomonas deanei]CAD2221319.1 hypothetical protein, conserved [Angomonas deanei]|eukprot:EPY17606.1 hypothetical protein AGDE_16158 [Angomonas deanei]
MNNLIAALPRGSVPIKEYNQWKNSVDYSLGSLQASIDEMRDNGRTDTDVSSAGFLEIKLDKLVDQVELIQRQLQKVEATTRVKPAENETDLRRQFVSINETLTKRLEGVEEKISSLNGIYVTEQGFKSFVENEFNTFCEHCTNEVNQVRSSLSERCDEIKELQDSVVKKHDLQISQAPKEESEKSVSDNDVGNDLILFRDELENRMQKSEEVIESLLNVHQKLNEAVQGNYYTKQVLEERFENLWNSIISLVARKDDSEAVNKKLSGLQKLLSEEIDIQLKGLSSELNNTIAAKVSFAELQEILSRQLDDV